MTTPRPDKLQFSLISANEIRYAFPAVGEAMPITSSGKTRHQEPHPDYFSALDELIPFVIDVMDLGSSWESGSIGSLSLAWTDDGEIEPSYKITSIEISRPSASEETMTNRKLSCPRIVSEDIPDSVLGMIDRICDEAWSYCTGEKTSQATLFEMPLSVIPSGTRSKARTLSIAS